MKKRLLLIIAVLFCVLLLIATATACKDDGDTGENPGGDVIDNPGGDTGENPGDNPGGDTGENPGGDTGENPGGDVTENPEPEVYYTVTFDTQGGSAMASVEVKEGAVIGNVTLPTKQCAEFVGFAEDANGEVIWDIASDKVTGNITLYAIWEDAHTWEAWETVSEPTCTAEGMRKRICWVCGKEETESIPVTEHTWGAWETVTEPTCIAEGLRKHECAVCGDDETERIPALGHDFEEEYTVDVAPDCVTKGSESRHCTRCDATTDSREIEATGHTWGEWATLTEPTCIDEGLRRHICEVCGEEDTDSIPALGHDFTKWGYDDEYHWKICSRCGSISETTAHVYDEFEQCECGTIKVTPESEFTFTALGDGKYSLAGYSGARENIKIPATYNGGTVVSIESSAFSDCKGIISVIIPDSVTSIGSSAFYGCTGLTSVYYTGDIAGWCGITFEGYQANPLDYAGNLYIDGQSVTELVIPDSVTEIKGHAFSGCTGLTAVTIPDSVTSIGEGAFSGCSSLESITIPFVGAEAGKTSSDTYQYPFGYIFGTSSYTGGTKVTQWYYGSSNSSTTRSTYYIPSSLRSVTVTGGNILYRAFDDCSMLTSVTMGNSVESIGDEAFVSCTGLTSVTIGNSVTSIGDEAFNSCRGLSSVTIGNSVTSIGDYAFLGCKGLTSVTIGNSVASIGAGALSGCSSLESITVPFVGAAAGKTSSDKYQYPLGYIFGTSSYTGGTRVEQDYYGSSTSSTTSTTYYIPASLRSVTVTGGNILYGAFYGCSMLTSVRIPDSVEFIGDCAFRGCTGLTSVTIPDSVTAIGDYAFYDCEGLTTVTIGTSVTRIGSYAFSGCSKLVEVYNKSSQNITAGSASYGNVGYYAKHVYTEENGSWFTDTADGYRFLYDGKKGYLVSYFGEATAIILPDSFTAYDGTAIENYAIYQYAFYGNIALTSVTIPDSVTSIGSYAFRECTGLNSVTIGNSVTSIGYEAFYYCTGLNSVTIGNSVTSIGSYAFRSCTGLNSVTIGNSVTSIGVRAFWDCTGLTSVTIGDSVTSIGDYAFSGCTNLTSVVFEDIEGWQVSAYSDFRKYTSLASGDLADASRAAEYLRSRYDSDYWRKVAA